MERNQAAISIVIADDHEIFRDGFQVMINKYPGIRLLGQAADGQELLDLVEETGPDVVLTDIKMPRMDGLEATRKLLSKRPGLSIIALSMFDEDSLIVDMLEAGVRGYLLKNTNKEEIIEAIRTVHNRQNYYCRHTSTKLMQMIGRSNFKPQYARAQKPQFNDRELEVIRLICEQLANKEIAARMHLSIRTIEGYREKIQEKMDVRNTAGIVVFAIKAGIYQL